MKTTKDTGVPGGPVFLSLTQAAANPKRRRELEAAVVASVLLEPSLFPLGLKSTDFSEGQMCCIWQVFEEMNAEHEPIDPILVQARLGPNWLPTMLSLTDNRATTCNAEAYASALRRDGRTRRLLAEIRSLVREADIPTCSQDWYDRAKERLLHVLQADS